MNRRRLRREAPGDALDHGTAPEGSVSVKEEYEDEAGATLAGITVMKKVAGYTPMVEFECTDGVDEDLDTDTDCEDADGTWVPDSDGACVNKPDLKKYEAFDANVEWNKCVPPAPAGAGCGMDAACNAECVATTPASACTARPASPGW